MTTSPIDIGTATAAPGGEPGGAELGVIEGRSLGRIAWERLKRERVAMISLVVIGIFVFFALTAPLWSKLTGHGPDDTFEDSLNEYGLPNGPLGGISHQFWLGLEPGIGRDIFVRLVYGARTSLLIATTTTVIATLVGIVVGITAGYLGGRVDTLLSRLMDLLLAFPQLLFILAFTPVLESFLGRWHIAQSSGLRIIVLISIMSFFGWPYMARIVRGQTLSLREREFIEAARSVGARTPHILFRQLLPNMWAPILIAFSLNLPAYITTEAALTFLGVGVIPPTPDWGQMLLDSVNYRVIDPMFTVIPGVALFLLVLSFNLFGDGLRDALDPRSSRL